MSSVGKEIRHVGLPGRILALGLSFITLFAALALPINPPAAQAASCSKLNAIKVEAGKKFICKKVGNKLTWVRQGASTVVSPRPSQVSEWSSCSSVGRTTSNRSGTLVCVLVNSRNVWVSTRTLDSKQLGSPCRTVGQKGTRDGVEVVCERLPGGNQWVSVPDTAPDEAQWATYGQQCSNLKAVANGKGADGSNLVCKVETSGSYQGQQIWAYPEFPIISDMDVYISAGVGGGYDTFGRQLMNSMKAEGTLVNNATFRNVPGAGGTTGLNAFLTNETGNSGKGLVIGFPMLGGVAAMKAPNLVSDATAAARMTAEWELVVVPANSPYRSMADLVADIRAKKTTLPIAGSNLGGIDHYTTVLIYEAIGMSIRDLNYIVYSGGAQVTAALLNGSARAGITTYGEVSGQISAGTLRVLGVTSPTRVPGIAADTLQSQGIDVVSANWRGLMLPKGTSTANRNLFIRALDVTRKGVSWNSVLALQRWSDYWDAGDSFGLWLKRQETSISATYRQLGL